ncbi:uncharacterized protein LOC112568028 [Pomacea canaliculata]|uniref:uncharacterized protein LOC112568028 n=1 Tax=Pomacea canaliculata TaxID=400727 RepID=UPI000D734AC4|nr:uncharacterized protein LOC112568028 [Pomacea canaliculata]XP_025100807.1 uncharacterized protein LOC112568028 [Pomacea canaliculata]XP_025100808.1 uncharacterized protein LOC112568028 [Pomacea canaliculata]XP_025100809.1 uncharacterized protein LOC112568028 [Pomacea canaliculata]
MTRSFMHTSFVGSLLLSFTANALKETKCTAMENSKLTFTFPVNINSTQTDFSIYFYPDSGGEEKLIDCAWIDHQLYCIGQEGFECQQPVSDIVVITVPLRFVNKKGSYGCSTNGFLPNAITCRFSGRQDNATCEAIKPRDGAEVIFNCRFSFNVDSFSIEKNKSVLASITKSECQSSSVCQYDTVGGDDMFHVTLTVKDDPGGEYVCRPNTFVPQLQAQVCSLTVVKDTESSSVSVVPVVLPVVGVLALALVLTLGFVIVKKRRSAVHMKREDVEESKKLNSQLISYDRYCDTEQKILPKADETTCVVESNYPKAEVVVDSLPSC